MQPGVSFSQSLLTPTAYENATAVPVFIGYTETGEPGELYAIESFADYKKCLGASYSAWVEANDSAVGTGNPVKGSVLYYALQHYFDNNGGRCFVLCINQYTALKDAKDSDIAADLSNPTVLSAIATEPEISLVAVPDIVLIDWDTAADEDKADDEIKLKLWFKVWQALLQIPQEHFNLFCILDTPASVKQTINCKQFISDNATYAAAYWPHLITDYGVDAKKTKTSKDRIKLPPSAAVIAAIQHTDRERGIWKAPANIPLSHVIKPEFSQWETEKLFSEGTVTINAIRSFPGRGVRIWGCRTLVNNSNNPSIFQYVQTRRLVSYIETHLTQISRFFVFEPNNELTWIKLKGFARSWLRKLWQSGGLFGTQEDQAFQLFLGIGESMTQEDIKQGKMIMRIDVALLYPAEFIKIELQLNTRENESRPKSSYNRSVLV